MRDRIEAKLPQQDDDISIRYGELEGHLGYFIRRAQYWIFRDANRTLLSLKLDVIRYSILEMIGANPGISQITLSGALGIERARLVALLDNLQHLNFLVRERSATDRRSHELQLTPRGRTTLKKANTAIAEHEKRLIQRIGSDDYKIVLTALSNFRSG